MVFRQLRHWLYLAPHAKARLFEALKDSGAVLKFRLRNILQRELAEHTLRPLRCRNAARRAQLCSYRDWNTSNFALVGLLAKIKSYLCFLQMRQASEITLAGSEIFFLSMVRTSYCNVWNP